MKIGLYVDPLTPPLTNYRNQSARLYMDLLLMNGHEPHYFYDEDIQQQESAITGIHFRKYKKGETTSVDENKNDGPHLEDMDLLFLKKDRPNKDVLQFMKLNLEDRIPIINGTNVYETHNKKFCGELFPEYMPESIYSQDPQLIRNAIEAFSKQYGFAIVKPTNDGSGRSIHRFKEFNSETQHTIEDMLENYQTEIIVQQYLPEATQGDKRILSLAHNDVLETIPIAIRKSAQGSYINNLSKGGLREILWDITPHEREVIQRVAKELTKHNTFIVGFDFIGKYLTEINTMSVGSTLEPEELTAKQLPEKFGRFVNSFRK
jgi:glutathione synthase